MKINPLKTWFEIFKIGKQTSSTGFQKDWTEKDLKEIATAYNESVDKKLHEAPITVNHPTPDNPFAYGWTGQLKYQDGSLLAKATDDIVPEFATAVEKKMLKKRSASFYHPEHPNNPTPGKWNLNHIAFLGSLNPAVKGLKDLAFDEKDDKIFSFDFEDEPEFSEDPKIAELQKQLKAKNEELSNAKSSLAQYKELGDDPTKLKEKIEFQEDAVKVAQEKSGTLELRIRNLSFQQYLNDRMAYGNLTPAQVEMCSQLLQALETVKFSEKNGKKVFEFTTFDEKGEMKTTDIEPVIVFKNFVESIKDQGPKKKGSVMGDKNNEPEPDLEEKAKNYVEEMKKEGKTISFSDAIDAIKNKENQ